MTMIATDALNIVRYSAMTQLIDGFTRQPLVAEKAHFLLDNRPVVPQSRSEGVYVFSNLSSEQYLVDIQVKYFFSTCLDLSVTDKPDLQNTVHIVNMQPAPDYPYPVGLTLLRGQVTDKNTNQPLPDVAISASYLSERNKTLQASTKTAERGRYAGRYALPVKGRLADETSVNLTFTRTGYQSCETQINMQRAITSLLNVQMQPS